jgi:hypothetical protein
MLPSRNALSSASRARPLASGTRWPYRSTVVVIDLWPSQRDTSVIGTPQRARYWRRVSQERAEDQAACSGQRPREFSCIGRVANLSVRVWKASRGSEPWRSAYLRNEAKFVVARMRAGPPPSAAPLRLLYIDCAVRIDIAQIQ